MSRERIAFLLTCLGGTVCLFGLLIFFGLRNQPHRTRFNTPPTMSVASKQTNAVVPNNPIPTVSPSRRQLVERGHEYARNADWQKAFECFRQVLASGQNDEWLWAWATGSALAAGETNACRELCVQMMETLGKANNSSVNCAKFCLALPNCSGELLDKAAERADFAIRKDKSSRWGQLVKGMADYRRENWSSALDWLRQPEESGGLECPLLAWCLGAMARHQLGDAAGAAKLWSKWTEGSRC